MTDTICQILGLHEPDPHTAASTNLVTNDYFGIEIEVESIVRNQPNVPSWKCVHDGSLRNNGQEFIFAGPTCGIKAVTALRELDKALCNNTGAECNDRTSTHVHVDVRDLTPKQLKTFLLLSIMFEEVFMRKTGNRANNSFCCRFAVSDAQLKAVSAIGDMPADPEQSEGAPKVCHHPARALGPGDGIPTGRSLS